MGSGRFRVECGLRPGGSLPAGGLATARWPAIRRCSLPETWCLRASRERGGCRSDLASGLGARRRMGALSSGRSSGSSFPSPRQAWQHPAGDRGPRFARRGPSTRTGPRRRRCWPAQGTLALSCSWFSRGGGSASRSWALLISLIRWWLRSGSRVFRRRVRRRGLVPVARGTRRLCS